MRVAGATAGSSAAATSLTASNEKLAAATSSARIARSTSGRDGDDRRCIFGLLRRPLGDGGCSLLGGAAEIACGQVAEELHHPFFLLPVERDHSPVAREPDPRVIADRAAGEEADFERQVSVRVPPERDRVEMPRHAVTLEPGEPHGQQVLGTVEFAQAAEAPAA